MTNLLWLNGVRSQLTEVVFDQRAATTAVDEMLPHRQRECAGGFSRRYHAEITIGTLNQLLGTPK